MAKKSQLSVCSIWTKRRVNICLALFFCFAEFSSSAKTFLREINTMSRLQHPNITLLVGVAVSSDDCYLLTEYVQRGSLFDLIHSKRRKVSFSFFPGLVICLISNSKVRMSWANVITVLRGTTVGMDYLHSMDPPFLHRDLKSQNLLIGDHWLVKICDFGMARVKSLGVTMTKLGTLQWVAPEVLRDERYSEKADIYSFAILIWELIARKFFFFFWFFFLEKKN
jgi:serine/threonine protein kinase